MRSGICVVLGVVVAGCHSKPEPAASDADAELQRFLNGMLVTSDIPPPVEQVWPIIDPDEPEFSTMAGPAVQFFGKMWDLPNEKAVRRYLETPVEKMNRSHAWALGHMEDDLTALKVWQKLLKEDPDDLEAAIEVGELTQKLQGSQAAVDAIAATSGRTAVVRDDRADSLSPGHLEGFRCELLLQTHHLEEAQKACDLAIQLDEEYGQRALAKVLLALGKNKEALVQARRVTEMPGRMADPGALLTLGLAQQYNGLDSEALETWNVGLARWPGSVYLRKAVDGPKRTVFEWQEDEFAQDTWWQAERLALCGHKLSELGMTDRANECYRQSERLEPGHSLPHQLVFMGMKEPQAALEKALAAVKSAEDAHSQPSLRLLSATGWLYFQLKKFDQAKVWVKRALDWWDWDPKAMSLMWQICGEEKDYLCVIRYRKQLGLPTHFNVEQYRDVKRAWQEQALKNGVGLASPETASTSAQKPLSVRAVEIVPLAARVPPELDGMAEFLRKQFPSLKITIGEREDLPAGALNIERHQLMWERLIERLREEPGRIYVVEEDLSSYEDDKSFAFARYDLAKGRGVVSLSRMRSLVGDPTDASTTYGADILKAIRHRLASELLRGVGKLLGVSFPCPERGCAMHERRSIADFVLTSPAFCPRHQKELTEALARAHAP